MRNNMYFFANGEEVNRKMEMEETFNYSFIILDGIERNRVKK